MAEASLCGVSEQAWVWAAQEGVFVWGWWGFVRGFPTIPFTFARGALFAVGGLYKGYLVYNNHKEKEAKKNDPEPVFHANDQQDDAGERKIKKRAILVRLVYGMYDRFRRKPEIEYKEWWTKVHYQLIPLDSVLTEDELRRYATELEDERKDQYFGVFQRNKDSPLAEAPECVVAIRGTELFALVDLYNDAKIVFEKLNSSNLIKILEVVVRRLVTKHGYRNVNVTGHSLGAAAGLMVCRRLALEGCLVECHFFNPPFTTLESLARSAAHVVKRVIVEALPAEGERIRDAAKRAGSKLFHAVVDHDTDNIDRRNKALAEFKTLAQANWSPYLYVNKHDFISYKFVSHFTKAIQGPVDQDRKKWYSPVTELTRKIVGDTESFHLIPLAHLVLTNTTCVRPISAHMLWNWSDPRLSYQFINAKLHPKT
ncbi:hypothetical protein MPTK1_5g22390 [Marchantia polymorpha subsp. ruderalis]|uniref:Fungal lipase-type domain-containing protein n=2 Tax=Marchantia polymorpha TaxID=3197 RepID=A0A176WH69_MARPO|nr:hypothetical protein AXG93_3218s1010 [Marchantia polymorpha subsp. ruderalis]PTQ46858.1 hypothetical protein MARPO_0010s0218 [Marchantia polymorpha]BBN12723.1 hypothetical protein Mp_5g22390 [Marchantia polymorpha subsp. ruderalis]|eukprot:PTQ46858.1 hypothetical protein MARPO_0010s0218 [Marchantia polymorpha]